MDQSLYGKRKGISVDMKNRVVFKIGFVGMMQDNFGGKKYDNFEKSLDGVRKYAENLGASFYGYPKMVLTPAEAEDAVKEITANKVDFLLIQTTTFPDGNALIKLAKSATKLGIWGLPEDSYRESNFIHSNNSFCGINMASSIIANYLKGLNIKYKWFFGHVDEERFYKRFYITVKALSAMKKLANARVALVGGIAPGFKDLYFDERTALGKLGIEIQSGHEFAEIEKLAHTYTENQLTEFASCFVCGSCRKDVTRDHLVAAARYYQAYTDFCQINDYDALAVSCWPQIKAETLACSVIGKLNQNGIPASCEGDLPGAVSMLLLHYITEEPVTLMDMCGFDESDDTLLMWHCGPSPEFYADESGMKTTCSYQLNLAGDILQYGLINDLKLKPQPVTFMRITGEWDKMFLLSGQVSDTGKDSPDGSRGWVGSLKLNNEPVHVMDFINTILTQGFQHHYPMAAGELSEILMEIASWLELSMICKVPYQDYLQSGERR